MFPRQAAITAWTRCAPPWGFPAWLGSTPTSKGAPRWSLYRRLLREVDEIEVPFTQYRGFPAWHLMVVLCPDGRTRDTVRELLHQTGIQTSLHYRPIHLLEAYRQPGQKLP